MGEMVAWSSLEACTNDLMLAMERAKTEILTIRIRDESALENRKRLVREEWVVVREERVVEDGKKEALKTTRRLAEGSRQAVQRGNSQSSAEFDPLSNPTTDE